MNGLEAGQLTASFRRLISATGPISLMHYMGEANAHYYSSRDPLGSAGDFVTAPEISQIFGELVGLWLADMWINAGRADPVYYVELGPGRGTLARDALRVMKRFGLEPQIHFVESSAALKGIQQAAIPGATWHHDLSTVPLNGPILLVGNEFLDALPVRQLVKTADGWRERMVAVQDDKFVCIAGQKPMDAAVPEDRRLAKDQTIIETCPGAAAVVQEVSTRLANQGGAALLVDYGHDEIRDGSTLQAVRAHKKVDPFIDPGEADLTALVDFAALASTARSEGANWLGTATQGDWLRALGIEARADALSQSSPDQLASIESAKDRLIADEQMGQLFKVMGLASLDWQGGAGF